MAGPWDVKTSRYGRAKRYLMIFTCSVTRAVNCEKVDSQSAESFALALRRHCAVHSPPSTINTDNGSNLVAIKTELEQLVQNHHPTIKWWTNPPLSPRFGGHFEIMVRLAKSAMERLTRTREYIFTDEQLETLFKEVQNHLNLRPLTKSASDLDDGPAITPADFMLAGSSVQGTLDLDAQGDINRKTHLLQLQSALSEIKKQMELDYLSSINEYQQRKRQFYQISEGDLVMVLEKGGFVPKYKLGKIIECHLGPDGIPRSVTVAVVVRDPSTLRAKKSWQLAYFQRSYDGVLLLREPEPTSRHRYL